MSEKTVFISYSHDTPEHTQLVLQLANTLRSQGVDVELDQYHVRPPLGWPRWCEEQLRPENAAFVLVICTATYRQRVEGKTAADEGRGVFWEGGIIYSYLYNKKGNKRFIPVLLPGAKEDDIPRPLLDDTRYHLKAFDLNDPGYLPLYRELTSQPAVTKPPTGAIVSLPPDAQSAVNPLSPLPPRQILSRFIPADLSRILKYAPAELIGREAETRLLSDAWDKVRNAESPRPHVLTFVALGGEGKTSLVAKWAAELAGRDWPGCDAAFAWSFYSQGTRDQAAASSDTFLKEALIFFGDPAMAGSAQGAFDKGRRLAQLVGERRALLILDGLEPLQYAPTSPTPGELKDQGLAALLKGLAAFSHGLCVVTTRYSIPDLKAYWQTTAPEVKLKRLSPAAGVALLRSLGVKGTQQEFETLVEEVQGHALTLNLLGTYLRDAHAGDIRKRDLIRLAQADAANEHPNHAAHVMDAYVAWMAPTGFRAWMRRWLNPKEREAQAEGRRALALLRLLGLFDRPASADCLTALFQAPAIPGLTEALVGMSEAQQNLAFTRLESAKLLTVNRDPAGTLVSLDAHPLLREYFGGQLRQQHPEAWQAAHRRLYEHLCATTEEGDQPTLEDLQPLYQAVAHACQAGLQQEACDKVYFARITRGNEAYTMRKLGALGSDLGAVACFFEQPWNRVSPALREAHQAWLLNEAAFTLRALGRLTEALEPMRAGLKMGVKAEDWDEAARRASNLSELELTLGAVAEAVGDAEQSVTYADRSNDAFLRCVNRVTVGDALHQAGRRAEAHFRKAEDMQAERQPDYPLLYSLQGFRYCDLLLAEAERGAWQTLLGSRRGEETHAEDRSAATTSVASCRAVEQRAEQTLKWMQADSGAPLLDIPLDHLTLGRAALYGAVLASRNRRGEPAQTSPSSPLGLSAEDQRKVTSAATELDRAVAGLRRAGQQCHIPLGLLSRAWYSAIEATNHRLLNQPQQAVDCEAAAQRDLDEAWEIAERGPMPLFQADILLYRARLFGLRIAEAAYPWTSPRADLAEARRLIEKHGYWRRREELEDAEAAARDWPPPVEGPSA